MMIWKRVFRISAAFWGMLALILDHNAAIEGAQSGILLCAQSVIPALLPFIFLSNALVPTQDAPNTQNKALYHANILLSGYLGGYPTGAQCTAQAYQNKRISKQEAFKLTICSNNPGPAFIFGIVSQLFCQKWIPWTLWMIHMFSSFLLYVLIPSCKDNIPYSGSGIFSVKQSLIRSTVNSIGIICGWVILFRTFIYLSQRWFMWLIPETWAIFISGCIEITNGCIELGLIDCIGLRYMLCAFFLSFGGICTVMQTYSLSKEINCKGYAAFKVLEGSVSLMLAYYLQRMFLPTNEQFLIQRSYHILILVFIGIFAYFLIKSEKISRISFSSVV